MAGDRSRPNSFDREMRRYETLGVLRGGVRDTACEFTLCQAKPEHDLNPETLKRYTQNRLRVVPELVYSPYATPEHFELAGAKAKAYRIDLVLFVNGIPVATLELKSEFKQSVENAIQQRRQVFLGQQRILLKSFFAHTHNLLTAFGGSSMLVFYFAVFVKTMNRKPDGAILTLA